MPVITSRFNAPDESAQWLTKEHSYGKGKMVMGAQKSEPTASTVKRLSTPPQLEGSTRRCSTLNGPTSQVKRGQLPAASTLKRMSSLPTLSPTRHGSDSNSDADILRAALMPAHHKNAPQASLIEALQALFDAYDGNGNGILDVDEFVSAERALEDEDGIPKLSHECAVASFFQANSGGTGGVCFPEFKKYQIQRMKCLNLTVEQMISSCHARATVLESVVGRGKVAQSPSRRKSTGSMSDKYGVFYQGKGGQVFTDSTSIQTTSKLPVLSPIQLPFRYGKLVTNQWDADDVTTTSKRKSTGFRRHHSMGSFQSAFP